MTESMTLRSTACVEGLGLRVDERPCPDAFSPGVARRFEFNSRGDRVNGRLLLPRADGGPFPLILVQPDAGDSMSSDRLDFTASWVKAGAAVATIDLSLQGERSSPKFSERLLRTLHEIRMGSETAEDDENGVAILIEFVRQSLNDLARTLDALSTLPAIDAERIAFVGIGTGGSVGTLFCSLDSRPGATALIHCGGGGPARIDPLAFIPQISPRPVLLVLDDSADPAARIAGDELFEAAKAPRDRLVDASGGSNISAAVSESVWKFLADSLGIA